jgi:hypothetical protein
MAGELRLQNGRIRVCEEAIPKLVLEIAETYEGEGKGEPHWRGEGETRGGHTHVRRTAIYH